MIGESLTLDQTKSNFRWVMLALCALTPPCVVTLPNLSLPPMFATISQELDLSLVEVGTVWGVVAFAGIFFAMIGGTLGDRFGTRKTLVTICLFTGLFGLLRGFAVDFNSLLVTSLLYGFAQAIIPLMLFKVIRHWFPTEQLGMASGVISAGFATGLMLGPLLSTSVILPALGGWRQVLLLYGVVSIIFSLLWLFVHPTEQHSAGTRPERLSLGQSLRHVIRLRNLWILAISGLGISACFQGFTGYFPTYLKAIGWADLDADRALAIYFLTSLVGVIPLSILSDRLRIRRGFLVVGALVMGTGIGSLSFVEGGLILLVIGVTGIMFDAFMAIYNASVLEVKGVGYLYAGTAMGLSTMIRNLGSSISPPLGNSLAVYGPSVPFLFWGGMGLFAMAMFAVSVRTRRSKSQGD